MINNILILAWEYFKIGAVAIGGGYTVIPFLYYLVDKYKWFDVSEITQMIAISNLTPGPIGINMATFVGLKVGGIASAILTTIAFMLPSFVIICFVSKFLKNNKNNKYITSIMYGLRPAAIALVASAGIKLFNTALTHSKALDLTTNLPNLTLIKTLILFAIFTIIGLKLRKKPMLLIAIAIAFGLVIKL